MRLWRKSVRPTLRLQRCAGESRRALVTQSSICSDHITGVTDPSGLAVTITVIGVMQDEPVNAKGDGNTSPDAVIQAGAASVRAERSGNGNGRVYQLSFKADNGQGGVCNGTVKVSVPHSMGKRGHRDRRRPGV